MNYISVLEGIIGETDGYGLLGHCMLAGLRIILSRSAPTAVIGTPAGDVRIVRIYMFHIGAEI